MKGESEREARNCDTRLAGYALWLVETKEEEERRRIESKRDAGGREGGGGGHVRIPEREAISIWVMHTVGR